MKICSSNFAFTLLKYDGCFILEYRFRHCSCCAVCFLFRHCTALAWVDYPSHAWTIFFIIPVPFEVLNWNFGSGNLGTFFGQKLTLKLQCMRQTLQTNYFALLNNFLISEVRDILGLSKLSKYVSLTKQVDWWCFLIFQIDANHVIKSVT